MRGWPTYSLGHVGANYYSELTQYKYNVQFEINFHLYKKQPICMLSYSMEHIQIAYRWGCRLFQLFQSS
jgi:hypothetical protein